MIVPPLDRECLFAHRHYVFKPLDSRRPPRPLRGPDIHEGDYKLPYRLLKPKDYDAKQKYPLVIFLHGAGERGDDNAKQLVHGMNDFASDEVMAKYPAFVFAPQCPERRAVGRLQSAGQVADASGQARPGPRRDVESR